MTTAVTTRTRKGPPPRLESERFWGHVNGGPVENCWEWTAALCHGYGVFTLRTGRMVKAHRWAYEVLIVPIPEGLELDHLCRTPSCVNPWHLEPVTGLVNRNRTRLDFCALRGHPFDAANTGYWKDRARYCRECRRIRRQKAKVRRMTPPSDPNLWVRSPEDAA